MNIVQKGILEPVPRQARYLSFNVQPDVEVRSVVAQLQHAVDGESVVMGIGASLLHELKISAVGMRNFPVHTSQGIEIPSTPHALWFWLRGSDRGELIHKTREIRRILAGAFALEQVIDAFQYRDSRDLSGYEDGTENPEGEDAIEAAIVKGRGTGFDGSSFVAVQQWVHDLDHFQAMSQSEQDDVIGRHVSDNEEFDDAPESAHVKRTAQESFEPDAFMLRRSMPWADTSHEGLVFVAFGKSFNAFETVLNRMVGNEDDITDALFRFTRPVTGSFYWCPPMKNGKLDLSALGL